MIFIFTKKQIVTISVIILTFVLFCTLMYNPSLRETISTASIDDWGLSYQKTGEAPVGNASKEFLKQYDSYYVGNDTEKVIYLTFDAGFDNGNTQPILDALKKHNIKAAFFLVSNFMETKPDLVKQMVKDGHIVANHTYSHPDMSKISSYTDFSDEIIKLENCYKEITGNEMQKFYRPPQGKFNEENLMMAQKMGYKTIFWSLAYVDWLENKQPTKEEAFSKLLTRIHPGAVVLLHSTSKTNAEILDELLTKWKEMGYTFKGVDELK